jgi:predicted Zn-dependent peptidase
MTPLGTSRAFKPLFMTQQIHSHRLANGLTLIAEAMPWLESAAFTLLVPAGCMYEPLDRGGLGNLTCEMLQRGSGTRSSRQFVDDLENLGADTSASVSLAHTSFGGAVPAVNLGEVLAIYADVVQRPHLPEDQFDDARTVCIQEVRAVEDELSQKAMLELRRRHYGDPLGRANHGTLESLEAATLSDARQFFENLFHPRDAILAVAGKIEWADLVGQVERLFGHWNGGETPAIQEKRGERGYVHIPHEAGETHLGVAYDSIPYRDSNYFQARSAIGVLSDGMSSRLFTEVREKRGLVYTVYASCHSLVDRGSVFAYAGTTTEKAQETLDVMLTELTRLKEGVQEDELARLKAHLKTSLIMQQESSRSRAGSIAGDWYHLGRIRPLAELQQLLNGVTCETVNRYLQNEPPPRYTVVSLGEKPVQVQV